MANNWERTVNALIQEGKCDKRKIAFCATAKELPTGEFGMVVITLNGDDLMIFDCEGVSDVKVTRRLFTIPTSQIKKFVNCTKPNAVASFFSVLIKNMCFSFTYNGKKYVFSNCLKYPQIAAIEAQVKGK